jgi:hypothetical protein
MTAWLTSCLDDGRLHLAFQGIGTVVAVVAVWPSCFKHLLTAAGAYFSLQVVSLATVEPEGASQGAQQVLSSASVPFNGCNGTAAAVPSITINGLKMINFTTFTWTLNQSAVTSSQVTGVLLGHCRLFFPSGFTLQTVNCAAYEACQLLAYCLNA